MIAVTHAKPAVEHGRCRNKQKRKGANAMFEVIWHGELEGFRDLLPEEWFYDGVSIVKADHTILTRRGETMLVRCSVVCNGGVALLNYGGEHKDFNKDKAHAGVSEITFEDSSYAWMILYKWAHVGEILQIADVSLSKDKAVSVIEGNLSLRYHLHRERNKSLGSRLDQSQKARVAARATADRKLAASLS